MVNINHAGQKGSNYGVGGAPLCGKNGKRQNVLVVSPSDWNVTPVEQKCKLCVSVIAARKSEAK